MDEINKEVIELRSEFKSHLNYCAEREKRMDAQLTSIWERIDKNATDAHKELVRIEEGLKGEIGKATTEIRSDIKTFRVVAWTIAISVIGFFIKQTFFGGP